MSLSILCRRRQTVLIDLTLPPSLPDECALNSRLVWALQSQAAQLRRYSRVLYGSAHLCCLFRSSRYYCPSQDGVEYPTWVPQATAQGVCRSTTRSAMLEIPFPPNFKILFYGNSHLRQVILKRMLILLPLSKRTRTSIRPSGSYGVKHQGRAYPASVGYFTDCAPSVFGRADVCTIPLEQATCTSDAFAFVR